MKILVTPTSMQPEKKHPALRRLRQKYDDLLFNPTGKPLGEDELIPLLQDCEGYLAGLDTVSEKVLDACPKLRVVSRYGVGYDRVDIAGASARGIVVTNTPGANSQAVAELALGLMLCVLRRIPHLNRETVEGAWPRASGSEMKGKTLGILGLGAIGKIVARCCQAFGMEVLAYDAYPDPEYCRMQGIRLAALEEVLAGSDVLSLHMPSDASTYHMIDGAAIGRMKTGAVLINTSRGSLVEEEALLAALESGRLGGAGLDAFEEEPPLHPERFDKANIVVTPHTGAHTAQAVDNMANMAVDNLIAVLNGQDCPYRVN